MNLLLINLFFLMTGSTFLILSMSLPMQAFTLLIMTGASAIIIASSFSILLGIYTILIYASGLLVLLAYFVALSPNQNLNIPSRLTFMLCLSLILFINSIIWPFSLLNQFYSYEKISFNIITILTPQLTSLLVMIALILVLTMIAVVKISSMSSGPIRPWSKN